MSEMERLLARMGNVSERLELARSPWARRHWTQVRDALRRRLALADMRDQGIFEESGPDKSAIFALGFRGCR